MLNVSLAPDELRPFVQAVVVETIRAVEADRAKVGERLAFSEAEAAKLLGLQRHQLRDERRRGRVQASRGPGKRVLYSTADLLAYLTSNRWSCDSRESNE